MDPVLVERYDKAVEEGTYESDLDTRIIMTERLIAAVERLRNSLIEQNRFYDMHEDARARALQNSIYYGFTRRIWAGPKEYAVLPIDRSRDDSTKLSSWLNKKGLKEGYTLTFLSQDYAIMERAYQRPVMREGDAEVLE